MKRLDLSLSTLGLFGALAAGCGDVSSVTLEVAFKDSALQAATRRLELVVREEPASGAGCDALWSTEPTGLAETRSYVDYPNRNDVLGAPVQLSKYPKLSLFVYALPSRDVTTVKPIAGGCQDAVIDAAGNTALVVTLDKAP